MILRLFRRSPAAATIDALYGAIVAQARSPVFYEEFGVADTVEGRFEMIVLHLALLLRRLNKEAQEPDIAQRVFDTFCRDMDHNLREMGVGDLSVPKKMKKLAEAFYGRAKAYAGALSDGDPAALAVALERNVLSGGAGRPGDAERLARYARRIAAHLDALDGTGFSRGSLDFPVPEVDLVGAVPHHIQTH